MKCLVPILLLVAGCAQGDSRTITERKRETVPPQVARFLVEGERAFDRGVYGVALAMTDSVEQVMPDLADLHFLRGKVYTQLNQLETAQFAFQMVVELDPEYAGARFEMGLNNFRRGKLRDAIGLYQEERELGEWSGLLHELGRAYAKLGEADSARAAYEAAIGLDPDNAMAFMWLGQLLEESGDMQEALETSLEGLALRPDNLDYQYIVGTQYFRTERAADALPYLEPVASERPWHHGAQFNLGQVYMRLGREEEARAYFARADSAQQVQQQVNEAQDAINHDPETLENWILLAGLLRGSGQFDKAIEAYKVIVSFIPWDLSLQNNLAILYMENGQHEVAIDRFQAILRADSTLTSAWLNLGVAYANSGETARARSAWQRLLGLAPGHVTARQFLSRLDSQMEGAP